MQSSMHQANTHTYTSILALVGVLAVPRVVFDTSVSISINRYSWHFCLPPESGSVTSAALKLMAKPYAQGLR
jgi:hypothetical protein